MRVTDFILQNTYLQNINKNKLQINKLQKQLATQKQVSQPSDAPVATGRILRYSGQLGDIQTYINNAESGAAFVNKTISSMQSVQDIIVQIQDIMTKTENPLNEQSFMDFSQKIDLYIKNIVDYANTEYDGKYLFSGNALSEKAFTYDESSSSVTANVQDLGGEHKIKLNKGTEQKINTSGEELFFSVLKLNGNLDKNSAVGSVVTQNNTVYDADGNAYSLQIDFTKTADNEYSMQYTVTDSSMNTVASDSNTLKFDNTTGLLSRVDGSTPFKTKVDIPDPRIRFTIDTLKLKEKESTAQITQDFTLKGDIFNTLVSIKNKLADGEKPNENQVSLLNDFNGHVLDKLSLAGSVVNGIDNIVEQLKSEEIYLQELVSKDSDTDIAKAVVELQNYQYSLDVSYKISSMILPKSLLDYL